MGLIYRLICKQQHHQGLSLFHRLTRFYSSMTEKRGLVLGIYAKEGDEKVTFTPYAQKYNEITSGELLNKINVGGPIKGGDYRIYWNIGKHSAVAVTGLGDGSSWGPLEGMNGTKENVRLAAAAGAKALLKQKITNIEIEDLGDAENAAIGAILGTYKFQEYKSNDKQTPKPNLSLANDAEGKEDWLRGSTIAESQNFARKLMETPANLMTPIIFAQQVTDELGKFGVECIAHDKKWAEQMGMNSFLSVAKGSDEPPVFLELTYKGTDSSKEFKCLVGKGITFDSGGISIKPSEKMDAMRADMGGAACVSATIRALAKLKASVNVKGIIPLCENLPSGKANKPGDVVRAMNGKTICIDNTDAEGRLILADALCYCEKFKPEFILDIATLTGAIIVALGDCVAGVFTNNNEIWNKINEAGSETGDRMWRMPLYKHYTKRMTDYNGYDLNNIGKGKGAGSCKAAAFLQEFVPKNTPWIHVDMAGMMGDCTDQSYTSGSSMTGRPTRTLIEFVLRSTLKK